MASRTSIVLLRGVNVGGRKAFKPSQLVGALKRLDVVSLGAAGTLIVRRAPGETALRETILAALPFQAEIMICPAEEIVSLVESAPFARIRPADGVRPYVSVLSAPTRSVPRLPFDRPSTKGWEVRVLAIRGRYVLSLCRTVGSRIGLYPNEVVERELSLPATTRGWPTFVSMCERLRPEGGPA